jgi:hypothetical protein
MFDDGGAVCGAAKASVAGRVTGDVAIFALARAFIVAGSAAARVGCAACSGRNEVCNVAS